MSRHLATITFHDAGLFQRPRKPGTIEHKMITPDGLQDRVLTGAYTDVPPTTLLESAVANIYRVLLGVRPVPTFRGARAEHTVASYSELAVDLARRCRVNITSGLATNKDGETYAITSPQMTQKCSRSSWAMASIPWAGPQPLTYRVSWFSVSEEFGPETFQAFRDAIVAMLGEDALQLDMVTVFSKLYLCTDKRPLRRFFQQHDTSKYYPDTLLEGKTVGKFFGHSGQHGGLKHWHWHMVTRGINAVSRRDGVIQVLIDDETRAMLMAGPGVATVLDGGVGELTIETDVDLMVLPGEPTYNHEARQ